MNDISRDLSQKTPDAPFRWKNEALRALVAALAGSAVTAILNAVYKIRFLELGAYLEALPLPLLFISTGVFVVFSFVMRLTRMEWRRMRILTDCMLVLGLAGLSVTLVAALNIGAVPLGSFDLNEDNIYDERSVPVPRNLEFVTLRVSGKQPPGFSLELERWPAGDGAALKLEIRKLSVNTAIKGGQYYVLLLGEFTVPGPFYAGDTVRLNIRNAAPFIDRREKIKLELTGSESKE